MASRVDVFKDAFQMQHIGIMSVCGHFQAYILKLSIYKCVSRMKLNLEVALSVSNTGYATNHHHNHNVSSFKDAIFPFSITLVST